MKKALVIGIDEYPTAPLQGCVNDANGIANMLRINWDGSPNFSTRLLLSDEAEINTSIMSSAISNLFTGDADTVLLYFAGHGILDPNTGSGFIVSQNGSEGAWGFSLNDILTLANRAYPRIKSTVIILDSCHSGFAGEVPAITNENIAAIGNGVTILTACKRDEYSEEMNGHGLFTGLLISGLAGSSADIIGRVTPASLYAHIDQTLGAWEQRPIYKANVQSFITLRETKPKVTKEIIRNLPTYFPEQDYLFRLDPSFEPDRENIPDDLKHIPENAENAKIFKELQDCNRVGLVVPIDAEHMYYAAIYSTGCKLTPLGNHYKNLAKLDRI